MSAIDVQIARTIAQELNVRPQQVMATIELLNSGATVPFIARYRKEVTEGLDDTQLRNLEERLGYLREMEERRAAILKSIDEQGKLTPELQGQILGADTKARLEDLYLPYKPRRTTKGMLAREAGLEPLADKLLADPSLVPDTEAQAFFNAALNYGDTKAVLDGAKHILMERFAENADLLARLRSYISEHAEFSAKLVAGKENEGAKFRDYFEHHEALKTVPSHRALAMFRGRNEGVLTLTLEIPGLDAGAPHPAEGMIAAHAGITPGQGRAADAWLAEVVRWTWRVKMLTHLETDLLGDLKAQAEEEAIKVFAHNLKDLLMAAPAGPRATLGLDPGLRTGVKVAVVDNTGKLVDHGVIFPHEPKNEWDKSIAVLAVLCERHKVDLIAIGNGTASRETDKLAAELIKKHAELKMTKIVVSEAGASVYSASELAAQEFPTLDVVYRGGVSIARRLQDPLAELVKIDPKAIGVGQYQHDVNQAKLARSLESVVEDCVNAVGVDVNTASSALLSRIAGLNSTIAGNIVSYRDSNGRFNSRDDLRKVPRLGEKTFEQAAGFLRIMNGDNPLDASSVHPESYPVVEKIATKSTKDIRELLGDARFLKSVNAADYVDDKFGLPTVTDILAELEKPGRDPRPEFKTATFQDGVTEIKDLKPGMILEGVVTNVANFGAFVDIGVHQDGLVHISVLSTKFVKDPREVVRAGDIVRVKVVEVDAARSRIALTMRLDDAATPARKSEGGKPAARGDNVTSKRSFGEQAPAKAGSLGALLMKAGVKQ